MYADRKKHFPTLPEDHDEAISQFKEMQQTLLFRDEQFIYLSNDNGVVILKYLKNLNVLCNAQHVFGDGTFSYSPKFFNQLYTLHVYQNYFYVPVVFVFLKSKFTSIYTNMWRIIQNLYVKILQRELYIEHFHVNFKISAHNAILNLYPNCKIITF
jgi:hypothetical protein